MMTSDHCQMCGRWEADRSMRIVELAHSYVILNRDQFFPGYTLLFTRQHVTELFHLDGMVRSALMDEVAQVARALHTVFAPEKINYELLGNMVPHIHWHIIPRFTDDPLWPRPVWAEPHDERCLSGQDYLHRIDAIRSALT